MMQAMKRPPSRNLKMAKNALGRANLELSNFQEQREKLVRICLEQKIWNEITTNARVDEDDKKRIRKAKLALDMQIKELEAQKRAITDGEIDSSRILGFQRKPFIKCRRSVIIQSIDLSDDEDYEEQKEIPHTGNLCIEGQQ